MMKLNLDMNQMGYRYHSYLLRTGGQFFNGLDPRASKPFRSLKVEPERSPGFFWRIVGGKVEPWWKLLGSNYHETLGFFVKHLGFRWFNYEKEHGIWLMIHGFTLLFLRNMARWVLSQLSICFVDGKIILLYACCSVPGLECYPTHGKIAVDSVWLMS